MSFLACSEVISASMLPTEASLGREADPQTPPLRPHLPVLPPQPVVQVTSDASECSQLPLPGDALSYVRSRVPSAHMACHSHTTSPPACFQNHTLPRPLPAASSSPGALVLCTLSLTHLPCALGTCADVPRQSPCLSLLSVCVVLNGIYELLQTHGLNE